MANVCLHLYVFSTSLLHMDCLLALDKSAVEISQTFTTKSQRNPKTSINLSEIPPCQLLNLSEKEHTQGYATFDL